MEVFGRLIFYILNIFLLYHICQSQHIDVQPQQVHLSYRIHPDEMVVTWSTKQPTPESVVQYGRHKLTQSTQGSATRFVAPGPENRTQYIHRVYLSGLEPSQTYYYHCGSSLGWSNLFWFAAMANGSDWSPRFAVYGDLGNVNGRSIPRLQSEVQQGMYHAILHVGDFAYNMFDDNGRVGDEFMQQLEPMAAYVPYMTCPGNHENAYNFTHYNNRFTMTNKEGQKNNHYYSFDIGPVHVVSLSTEFYYFFQYGIEQLALQYDWLVRDLEEANRPENRAQRPWIITMGHRPMYCNTLDRDDCTHVYSLIRSGLPLLHLYGLEDLFYKNGVDLEFWAHEHNYQRFFPLYNRQVYNGSVDEPYTNPGAPVHIIAGSAGCEEDTDKFRLRKDPWIAFRSSDYGYARMTVHNSTHLHLEQVSDDKGGEIIDEIWIIKDRHGRYN